jgi:hypothetical protein
MAQSSFSAVRNSYDYAYGQNPAVDALMVASGGSTAGGTYSITLALGRVFTKDGLSISPTATTPITIGAGANLETVTPTTVSNPTPDVYGTCVITATFANGHGIGDQVRSGSGGIVEAMNAAHTTSAFGGLVSVDQASANLVAATHANLVTALDTYKGWTNVTLLDWTGVTGAVSYATTDGNVLAATAHVLY